MSRFAIPLITRITIRSPFRKGWGTLFTSFCFVLLAAGCVAPGGGDPIVEENFHPGIPAASPTTPPVVDTIPPSVSISSSAPTTTGTSPIPVTITFSEVVTGFVVSDLTLGNGTASNFAGSGTTYTFDLTPSGQGAVTVNIAAGVASDVAGNLNTVATQLTRTYDTVAPNVSISSTAPAITNISPIPVTVTFNEAVSGFAVSDLTLSNAAASNFSGTGTTYTFDLTPSGQGTVTVDIAAGVAGDAAGNLNTVATQLSRIYNNISPAVVISSAATATTPTSPIPITVTFSAAVTGFVVGDLTLSNGTASGFAGSGTTYTFNFNPSGQGVVTVDVAASVATDIGGNSNTAAAQFSRTYDSVAPSVAISSTAPAMTSTTPIPVTVTFNESVSGFVVGDLTLGNGTASNFAGSGTTYTFDLTPSGQGAVTVNIAAGVASDAAGNLNTVATQLTRTYDSVAPTVVISSAASANTKTSPIPVTVTFSKSVTGFVVGDLTLGNGAASNFSGSGTTYTFDLTPSGQGVVTVDIAAGVASDTAGNLNTVATQLTRTYDSVQPSVIISSLAPVTTKTSPIPISITFNESVTGFVVGDLTLGNGTASNFIGSGTGYSFDLTPTGQGVVTVDIAAGVATDAAGNSNTVATQLTRTYDSVQPSVIISSLAPVTTKTSPIPISVTFNESVSGFVVGDLTLGNGTASNFSGSGAGYSFDLTPTTEGAVTIDIAAGVASDAAGNLNTVATQLTRTYDSIAPTVAISSPTSSSITTGSDNTYTVTYTGASAVTLASGDITLNKTSSSDCASVSITGTGAVTRTVTLTNCTGGGTVGITIAASSASDAAGNVTLAAGPSTTFTVVATPAAPTAWGLSSPSNGTTSADNTPVVSASSTNNGAIVKLWVNDATCAAGTVLDSQTVASGSFTFNALTMSGYGLKTFYYTIEFSGGTPSTCATTGLSYTYQLPIFTLSRTSFSMLEDGTAIGPLITVTRDIAGVAGSVVLTASSVSARLGAGQDANPASGAITVTFAAGDLSKTVPATDWAVNDDALTEGDEYFRIRMSVSSGGTTDSTSIINAAVNILDNELTGQYFFPSPLVSVNENETSLTLTAQRTTTTGAAWVDVEFLDGTAINSTDFAYSTNRFNFANGNDEATLTVTINDNSVQADSKSFYLRMNAFSSGTKSRAWGVTKVRILDDDDTTVCDPTNNNTGTNLGFGGQSSGKYLICSLPQLWKMRDNPTLEYALMADIDADPSLDADTATGGTQAFVGPNAISMTKPFTGNERVIYNYTFTGTGSESIGAIFSIAEMDANANIYDGINVLYGTITATGNTQGFIHNSSGTTTSFQAQYQNILVSGYLEVSGSHRGMLVGYIQVPSLVSPSTSFTNIVSHGSINQSGGSNGGGVLGYENSSRTHNITFTRNHNLTNIVGSGSHVSGILGKMNATQFGNVTISNSENRGYISISGSSVGGVFGGVQSHGYNLNFTNNRNYGDVSCSSYCGGLYGQISNASGKSITLGASSNFGKITGTGTADGVGGILGWGRIVANSTTFSVTDNTNQGTIIGGTGSNYGAGGVIGSINSVTNAAADFTITGNTNSGTVISSGTAGGGGVVGMLSSIGSNVLNFNVGTSASPNINTGSVSGSAGNIGGIVGNFSLTGTGANTTTATSNVNSGTVTGSGSAAVGGLYGGLDGATSGSQSVTFSGGSNSGTITGGSGATGGAIGYIRTNKNNTVTIDASTAPVTNSGAVVCSANHCGGFIGLASASASGGTITIDQAHTTNTASVTTSGNNTGGFVGYITGSGTGTITIKKSYSSGNVNSSGDRVGGFFGLVNQTATGTAFTLSRNYSTGNASGGSIVGAFGGWVIHLAGGIDTIISNNFSSDVSVTASSMGGLFLGQVSGTGSLTLAKNYSLAIFAGVLPASPGGLTGSGTAASAGASYWLKDATYNTGVPQDFGGTAGLVQNRTNAQLQLSGTFSGWDFYNSGSNPNGIWFAPGDNGSNYPTLRNQSP